MFMVAWLIDVIFYFTNNDVKTLVKIAIVSVYLARKGCQPQVTDLKTFI
jgi:hypothetical protein